MNAGSSLLGFGLVVIALVVGLALWYLTVSTPPSDKRREERETKRISQQPWDAQSSDGRANR